MIEPAVIDVSELEKIVDQNFFANELPHPLKDIALWHLYTVSEDMARMLFSGHIEKSAQEIGLYTDESKYALRHCTSYIFEATLNESIPIPARTVPAIYEKAHALFMAGLQYEKFSRLLSSVHNNRGVIVRESSDYSIQYDDSIDVRYSALEALGQGAEPAVDITGVLHHWLTEPIVATIMAEKFIRHATVRKGRVVYKYDQRTVLDIAQQIPQRDEIIPESFVFPWGGAQQTHALINSLHVRCLYHLLTVEYVSREREMRGGAESSLLLVIDKKQLSEEIDYLASIGKENIYKFINFLTYGVATNTPDPALQPLVPTRSGALLISCNHILTSNTQRNILALMARTMRKEFDRQSKQFEISMSRNLSQMLTKWPLVCFNREFKIEGQREELDVLVLDVQEKVALIFELRWMVPPGDAREVQNRIKVCSEKVLQLERKILFVSKNGAEIVSRAFPDIRTEVTQSELTVYGVVVVQGFGGTVSPNSNIPIVTTNVLAHGLDKFSSVKSLYDWINSLSWLPQEGTHFSIASEEIKLGSITFRRPGFELLATQAQYVESVAADILAAGHSKK